jgi:hypothetical protein
MQWPAPQCVKDVRSFLGLTGYYRRFVEGYSAIAAPLSDLTHIDKPFVWGGKEMEAFTRLKQSLAQAPTLATPDNSKPYVLHTDASGYAVGATLSQDLGLGRGLQPVAFMSKKMGPAQRNYPVHEWDHNIINQCRTQIGNVILSVSRARRLHRDVPMRLSYRGRRRRIF